MKTSVSEDRQMFIYNFYACPGIAFSWIPDFFPHLYSRLCITLHTTEKSSDISEHHNITTNKVNLIQMVWY